MKKTTRRSKEPYPGLKKEYNLKIRQDILDQDYIDKLNPEEKQWLSNFNEEYVSANFKHRGKTLHRTKKLRKSVYDANNARNRDVYAITKSKDTLEGEKDVNPYINKMTDTNPNTIEDALIDYIDDKNLIDKKL